MDTNHRGSMLGRGQASGLRKLTPLMLGTIEVAERHAFTSEMQPGQVLAAFKLLHPFSGYGRASCMRSIGSSALRIRKTGSRRHGRLSGRLQRCSNRSSASAPAR